MNFNDAQMQLANGSYAPAIPLPWYGFWRKVCRCGMKFWREKNYRRHWQLQHSGLNQVYFDE